MRNHHDVYLPFYLYPFLLASFNLESNIITSHSGRDFIKNSYDFPIHIYKIAGAKINISQYEEFYGFFNSRKGAVFSFRLKDFGDFSVSNQTLYPSLDQPRKFKLNKKYNEGDNSYIRPISLIRHESIKLFRNGEECEYIFNENNSEIEIAKELERGENLVVSFEFDIRVRFITSKIEYSHCEDGSIALTDVILREVIDV